MTSFENLQELIDLLDGEPGITELSVHGPDGAEITVRRSALARRATGGELVPAFTEGTSSHEYDAQSRVVSIEEAELDGIEEATPQPTLVNANRVGIFHAAKQPLARGEQVAEGQIVGYIESMKLMNEIRADAGGEVAERLISDGTPVEYGQPLFRLIPSS